MKRRGFTLVELLVIAAVVEILAVIAVPRFLEAKIRSDVARCRASMRTMAVAIEAYHSDHNSFPTYHYTQYTYSRDPLTSGIVVEPFIGGSAVITYTEVSPFQGHNPITTPIAYMSSFPEDPFHFPEDYDPDDTRFFLYVNFEYWEEIFDAPGDYMIKMWGAWRITSGGPDLSRHDVYHILYDPTNGLTSLGQIHHSQRSAEGIPHDPW